MTHRKDFKSPQYFPLPKPTPVFGTHHLLFKLCTPPESNSNHTCQEHRSFLFILWPSHLEYSWLKHECHDSCVQVDFVVIHLRVASYRQDTLSEWGVLPHWSLDWQLRLSPCIHLHHNLSSFTKAARIFYALESRVAPLAGTESIKTPWELPV